MSWSTPRLSRPTGLCHPGPVKTRASGQIIAELGLWLVGIALIVAYFAASARLENHREQGLALFAQARAARQLNSPKVDHIDRIDRVATIEDTPAQDDPPAFPKEISVADSDAQSLPIAVLRMASVGLEVPVYPDISELNLNRGAGWIGGTAAPNTGGNIAIAAHRDRHFGALENIQLGDVLELESLSGPSEFRVSRIAIVEPDEVSVLDDTPVATVTLVTCYPFHFVGSAPQRYIVQATAVEQPAATHAADLPLLSLQPGETP